MLFKNTEREIISHIFNADPKTIPLITHIYRMEAELNGTDFKLYSLILSLFSFFAVMFYHHHDFEHWPVLSLILAIYIGVQIIGSMIILAFMVFEYIRGNIKLKMFNKIIAAYELNVITEIKEKINEGK